MIPHSKSFLLRSAFGLGAAYDECSVEVSDHFLLKGPLNNAFCFVPCYPQICLY